MTDLSGQQIPGATFAQAPVRPGTQTSNDAWCTNLSNTTVLPMVYDENSETQSAGGRRRNAWSNVYNLPLRVFW